jgi:hypothetical protein
MGDKGSKDIGKREQQKKAQLIDACINNVLS